MMATDWECHLPQEQMLANGIPEEARAAAPMRRRLCHVKADQGEFVSREWNACCRDCFEGMKGPPAAVAVGGARVERRVAQAEDQTLVGQLIQDLELFSSKKEMVSREMSEGRMLAASPTRRRRANERHARQVTRASVGERDLSAL